ncbi:lipopolysaccharide biosynthesis protein [Phyllobacterium salinisoli]|uniref:Lipopolysaccharide biosynthesis protein n=1 Tax=Phyllobacterium salinisoli TaxID=1899321 RepID=A0A368K970_9HYPH|nr:lipopolysaccharide biosynthesis protein [Phyllobacterium salinisoli]RCS25155.1 lipopolysaccharide biosynthesis protein [Phyllobacterium salinisoli]
MAHILTDGANRLRRFLPMMLSYAASSGSLVTANAAQLVTFAILARSLGADQFGVYVSFIAIASIAVHLCGLGANECLVRRVARDHAIYPTMLGHNLILIAASGVFLVVAGILILPHWIELSPDPSANRAVMLLMLITNIVLVKLILLTEQIFIAHSQFADANKSVVGFAFARTAAAALACLVFGVSTVAQWAVWQFACHVLIAFAYAWSLRKLGPPLYRILREEIRLGILFATPFIFRAIRQNADMLVLGIVATPEIVGSYGVVRRITDSSYMTIDALNRLVYPSLAVASAKGIHNAIGRSKKILVAGFGIGVASAVAIFLLAPFLPLLFGEEYVSLVSFTRILCWVVIFVAIWSVATEVLGAAGHHAFRAAILNTGNALGAILIAYATWLAPPQGTFISIYVIEGGIVIASWIVLTRLVRRSRMASNAKVDVKSGTPNDPLP